MNPIYIFGHKKPDTDSVVSSIALAYLKNKLGMYSEPRVLGDLNNETKFVLKYFNIATPKYLNDVKIQIKDINYLKNCLINHKESIYNACVYMYENKISTLPIVNDNNTYINSITIKDIMRFAILKNIDKLNTSYENLIKVIDGKKIIQTDECINGIVIIDNKKNKIKESCILLTDNENIVIDSNIRTIILLENIVLSEANLRIAQLNNLNIISTKMQLSKVLSKIFSSNFVTEITYDSNIYCVNEDDDIDDFLYLVEKTKYSNYPVLDKNKKCLGIIRTTDLTNKNKKKVILVDHNEFDQSVDNIEEADILEIIDHHKISIYDTRKPINLRNSPVGSTNTIIYKMFKENNIDIPNDIAGIMLSAIISDTLLFKSPTTTDLDKEVAIELSKCAEIDYKAFALDMFKAASTIKNKTPEEILYSDFKNFTIENKRIGIGQISTVNPQDILKRKKEYIELMNITEKTRGYYICCLFITDLINDCSYCIYNESSKTIFDYCFNLDMYQGIKMPGILSRKKQIIPLIIDAIEKK